MRAGGIPRWVSSLVLFPQTPMYERSRDHGVSPRFHTFEDYFVFSDTTLAEALHFPDLLTHTTAEASADELLAESRALRRFILDHFHEVERFYARPGAAPVDLASVRRTIANSFF
jgi:anaerobic magnesium-protoporphyrin IX monomethyl ester cyclase